MTTEGTATHKVLRREAEEIIARLGLLEMLRSYGRAEVVGSVALDLVVRRDIDIHLLLGLARNSRSGKRYTHSYS
jgi:hypothetical protein